MYAPAFFPEDVGQEFALPPLLEPLAGHRGHFTVFSNLDHNVGGGHAGSRSFLSGVRPSRSGAAPERNVTLDQKAAESLGRSTRIPVLNLGIGDGWEMCWTRRAERIRPLCDPGAVFDELFEPVTKDAARAEERRLRHDAEVLAALRERARSQARRSGPSRRPALDEYTNAVGELERRLATARKWLDVPKPTVDLPRPNAGPTHRRVERLLDLIVLAFQTDSTRVATLEIGGSDLAIALGLPGSYHKYSHHGRRPELIDALLRIERFQMEQLARFLDALRDTSDSLNGGTLLDHTLVLFGSGLGNGNSHSCRDLPILLAGGGLPHAGHVAVAAETGRRVPLCNLYLALLRHLGLEIDAFGTSTGVLEELAA